MGIKATFVLDEKVFSQAKELVEEGLVKSMSNLVETALKNEIILLKTEKIRQEIIAASKDPLFLADVEEITSDFSSVYYEEGTK